MQNLGYAKTSGNYNCVTRGALCGKKDLGLVKEQTCRGYYFLNITSLLYNGVLEQPQIECVLVVN
jgi:hypothetical protein